MDASSNSEDDSVEIFKPPHPIAGKVSVGGPNAITEDLLNRTEASLCANFGSQYLDWLKEDMHHLEREMRQLGTERAGEVLEAVRDRLHEMRGMGSTFQFELVTKISDQMYRLLTERDHLEHDRFAALRVHYDSLKMVFARKLKGDGGVAGQAIMDGLQKVYIKFA
jgi:hypothetical protein